MKKVIVFLLCICMIASITIVPSYASDVCSKYKDVDLTSWYHSGVHYVVVNGLMTGTSQNTFSPHDCTTRGMLVTILYRMSGSPHIAGVSKFADISPNSYYYNSAIWAYNIGIIRGTSETTFSPKKNITRQDLAVILMRYVEHRNGSVSQSADLSRYADRNDISSYALPAMKWAVGNGIINGVSDTELAPLKTASRAEVATMIMRIASKCNVSVSHEQFTVNVDLQSQIQSILNSKAGNWGVYVEKLNSGASLYAFKNTEYKQQVVSASLIKLWVMGAVYEKIAAGTIREADVKTELYNMITVSDNGCCNSLVRKLGNGNRQKGIAAVNSFAARYGFKETKMTRLMLENTGTQNYTSIRDCAEFLRMLYHGTMISPSVSASMLNIMKNAHRLYLAAGLPSSVKMAHKTGSLVGYCYGDVGIVYANEPYIICVINSGTSNGPSTLQGLSEIIYQKLR